VPLQNPFPSLEVGSFYCAYEDERWDEPEIIVDPLTGIVVAIMPRHNRPHRSADSRHERPQPSLWRDALARWLRLSGVGAALALFAVAGLGNADPLPLGASHGTREVMVVSAFGGTAPDLYPVASNGPD
jgi:hypothetical protein